MSTTHRIITKFLFLFASLFVANLIANMVLTEFWILPHDIPTKLGVFAQETLYLFLISSPLILLASFVATNIENRIGAIFLTFVPVFLLWLFLVTNWVFYALFERFIGYFAFQMLLIDGDQLLSFAQLMPTNLTNIGLSLLLVVSILTSVGSSSNHKWWSTLRQRLSVAAIVLIIVTVPMSLLLNNYDSSTNSNSTKNLSITSQAEYELLVRMSGPFTSITTSLSDLILSHSIRSEGFLSKLELRPRKAIHISDVTTDQTPPNLVVILVESLRKDRLAVYGGDPSIMPFVNQLSKKAYVFDRIWAQSSHSNYADIATISGQYPLRSNKIHFYPKRPVYPRSLPYDVLGPLGYRSGIFSSQNETWGQMHNYLDTPNLDVFSHVGSAKQNQSDNPAYRPSVPKPSTIDVSTSEVNYSDFMYQSSKKRIQRLDGETIAEATDWLDTFDNDQPFNIYINLQASHAPFSTIPKNFSRRFLTEDSENAQMVRKGHTVGKPIRLIEQAYNDSLHYVDSTIETLVSAIESKKPGNTVYLITADTSMLISQQLLGNGGKLYKDVLAVPAILHSTQLNTTELVKRTGGQIDLLPTAISLLGIDPHPASQGIDLIDENTPTNRIIFSLAQTPLAHQYSAVYGDWQLILDQNTSQYELYYVGNKPLESVTAPEDEVSQMMARSLQTWIGAQLEYYSNTNFQNKYYPPQFLNLHTNLNIVANQHNTLLD